MDWSQLWLSYEGKPNKIKVEQEHYMKHVVIDLNETNEVVLFYNSILGNYYFDTYYEVISDEVSYKDEYYKQSETLHCTHITEPYYNIVDSNHTNIDLDTNICLSYFF